MNLGLDGLGLGALEGEFWRVAFLMTRIGAALLAAPLFGATGVPVLVRVAATGAIAIFVATWTPAALPYAIFSIQGLLAVGAEVVVGLALGFVLQIAFAGPLIAAELIGGSMGMSMAVAVDPQGGHQVTAFGQYFTIVLTLVLFATGGHLVWLRLLVESYAAFPPGDAWLGAARFQAIAGFGSDMFLAGLVIALPVTLVLLLVQIVTSILSRSAPSLNLFALGLPAGVLAGIGALIVAAPLIFAQLGEVASEGLGYAAGIVAR